MQVSVSLINILRSERPPKTPQRFGGITDRGNVGRSGEVTERKERQEGGDGVKPNYGEVG